MKRTKHGIHESKQIINELLDLYGNLLVPFMQVRRDMPFPGENGRHETDGEHAFTVGMISVTLAERLDLGLDTGLIAKYSLVHDLVEAYAGDMSVRNPKEYSQKEEKEYAAFLRIKKDYQKTSPWIIELITKYEARADDESKFVYSVDKIMGAMSRMTHNDKYWVDYYPEKDGSKFHEVVQRLRKKAEAYPPLLPVFDEIHDELDRRWPEYLKANQK